MGDISMVDWLYDPFLDRVGGTINAWWGCERVSPACLNCYIFRQPPLRMRGLTFDKAGIGGKTDIIYADRSVLFGPLRKQAPRMYFIESLGDLWHGRVPIMRTAELFAVALLAPRHIFITTTKRAPRQRNWLRSRRFHGLVAEAYQALLADFPGRIADRDVLHAQRHLARTGPGGAFAPLPNMWIGTTVEDNPRAAERIQVLRETPAEVRWLSCEPPTAELTDPLDLLPHMADNRQQIAGGDGIHWLVFGGESGPAAKATPLDTEPAVGLRPIDLANLQRQIGVARDAGARVFVKQLGEPWAVETGAAAKKGNNPDEWPAALRIREYPVQLAQRAAQLDPGNAAAQADIHEWMGRALV